MINARIGDVMHAENRKPRSINFEIDKGFLEETAFFKDWKGELVGVHHQVHKRKEYSSH